MLPGVHNGVQSAHGGVTPVQQGVHIQGVLRAIREHLQLRTTHSGHLDPPRSCTHTQGHTPATLREQGRPAGGGARLGTWWHERGVSQARRGGGA